MVSRPGKMHKSGSNDSEEETHFPANKVASNKWSEVTLSQEEELEIIRNKQPKIDLGNIEQDEIPRSEIQSATSIYTPIRVGKRRQAPSLFDNAWLYDSESSQSHKVDEGMNSFLKQNALDGMHRAIDKPQPLFKFIHQSSTSGLIEQQGRLCLNFD